MGDHEFLKVSSRRGVLRFGRGGRLPLRYIGLLDIFGRIGDVTYRLALPPQLSGVHDVFYVFILRKHEPDPLHVLDWGELGLDADVTFEERPVQILDRHE